LIVPFDAYVSYTQPGLNALGTVTAAYTANPRVTTRGHELNWSLSDNGVQVHSPCPFVWLDYRLRCVKLSGDIWRGDLGYAAGVQVYYSSPVTPDNFYTCVTATNAAESPDTTPAKWLVVAIPRIFHKYLVLGTAADWLKSGLNASNTTQELQQAQMMLGLAQAALDDQKALLVGQQGQRVKTQVVTR
jgi:hypothetical protein